MSLKVSGSPICGQPCLIGVWASSLNSLDSNGFGLTECGAVAQDSVARSPVTNHLLYSQCLRFISQQPIPPEESKRVTGDLME
ncbi:MAG: hypothetical protein H7A46_18800 [Verrucomicrobiales bacterium]|nr:hypothetical protein [Verrucomicrobiales bacterium]